MIDFIGPIDLNMLQNKLAKFNGRLLKYLDEEGLLMIAKECRMLYYEGMAHIGAERYENQTPTGQSHAYVIQID